MDVELVRIDLALHDVLAETLGAGNEDYVTETGLGVERENDTARCEIGADHLHDTDRQRDFEVVEAIVDAVDDGPIGEDRREAAPASLDHVGLAADIQETLVLSRKASAGQILGRRRAADRHGNSDTASGLERAIGLGDLSAHCRIARRLVYELPGSGSALSELQDVAVIDVGQQPMQFVSRFGLSQRLAIGISCQRKPIRNPAVSREHRMELAQRGIFPPTSEISFSLMSPNQRT
jgi:hypothetical protein